MDLRLQPDPAHADGLANTLLAINDEILRENMKHALIIRDGLCLSRVEDALDILRADLVTILDRSDAMRVHAVNVGARYSRKHRANSTLCGKFRIFHGELDRLDCGVNICHNAFA